MKIVRKNLVGTFQFLTECGWSFCEKDAKNIDLQNINDIFSKEIQERKNFCKRRRMNKKETERLINSYCVIK